MGLSARDTIPTDGLHGTAAATATAEWVEEWRLSSHWADEDGTDLAAGGDSDTAGTFGGVDLQVANSANGTATVSESGGYIRMASTGAGSGAPRLAFSIADAVSAAGGPAWDTNLDPVFLAVNLSGFTLSANEQVALTLMWNPATIATFCILERFNLGGVQSVRVHVNDPVVWGPTTLVYSAAQASTDLWLCFLMVNGALRPGFSTSEPTAIDDPTYSGWFRPHNDNLSSGEEMVSNVSPSVGTRLQIPSVIANTESFDIADMLVWRLRVPS